MDGTLVDTAPDLAAATNALRTHHGLDPLPFHVIRAQVSNGGSALVTLALGLEAGSAEHDAARQFLLDAYEQALAVDSRLFAPLDEWLITWEGEARKWGNRHQQTTPLYRTIDRGAGAYPGGLCCVLMT